jgi:hypothetical protein
MSSFLFEIEELSFVAEKFWGELIGFQVEGNVV